mgnify:CR=1 FL=1
MQHVDFLLQSLALHADLKFRKLLLLFECINAVAGLRETFAILEREVVVAEFLVAFVEYFVCVVLGYDFFCAVYVFLLESHLEALVGVFDGGVVCLVFVLEFAKPYA